MTKESDNNREKKVSNEHPISLHSIDFEEALCFLVATPPAPKDTDKPVSRKKIAKKKRDS